MKVLTSKIVNGKKMFLIEDNNPQGKVFAQVGKPIKKENISNYNPYYVDVKGLNASESTKTNLTPATKITPQEIKKIKESPTNVGNIKIKEAQEKAQRLKEAEEAYKKRKAGAPITPELLAQETQAIGDKISLQNIPGVGQYIPDMLDVTGGIGSMASNLGALPLNLNRGNYGQALLSVAAPLATGALAGIGTQNTGQFVNNIVNPLAGTGEIIDNLGNKYLPNAHKLNPYAFKPNPEKFYRQIGDGADALESGVIRSADQVKYPRPHFVEGKDFDVLYSTGEGATRNNNIIAEMDMVKDGEMTAFQKNVNSSYSPYQANLAEVPLSDVKLYKQDWLKGYKEIQPPKSNFKSEIDWGKWNKEIPDNKALMQEYNAIEQQAKADDTWMKNPDGSKFQGTPEQFVQQNSENFKKAFGNSKTVNQDGSFASLYHGSDNKNIKEFLSPKRNSKFKQTSVTTKNTDHIYFSPEERIAKSFMNPEKGKIYEVYSNITNPQFAKSYAHLANPSKGIEELVEHDAITNIDFSTMKAPTGPSEIAIPYNNYVKSAVGNNGMFDMTNPNIYKTLIPGAMTLGALNQTNEKQFGGTIKVLDTKIEKNKKYYLINE